MELYLSDTDKELYVAHYHLWYKVVAIFTDDDVNNFMENHDNTSVINSKGNIIVIVNTDDQGRESV